MLYVEKFATACSSHSLTVQKILEKYVLTDTFLNLLDICLYGALEVRRVNMVHK